MYSPAPLDWKNVRRLNSGSCCVNKTKCGSASLRRIMQVVIRHVNLMQWPRLSVPHRDEYNKKEQKCLSVRWVIGYVFRQLVVTNTHWKLVDLHFNKQRQLWGDVNLWTLYVQSSTHKQQNKFLWGEKCVPSQGSHVWKNDRGPPFPNKWGIIKTRQGKKRRKINWAVYVIPL